MYSLKPGNWPSQPLYLKIHSGCYARENPSEETISKSNQITDLHETINLLMKQSRSAMLQQKHLYLEPSIFMPR